MQQELVKDYNDMSEEEQESFLRIMKTMFPDGDPFYMTITVKEMAKYSEKNFDYAGGGDPNGNFFRVASILSNYPNLDASHPVVIALIYALKQLDQVLWSLSRGFEGKIEGLDSRLVDIHIYVKICRVLIKAMDDKKMAWGAAATLDRADRVDLLSDESLLSLKSKVAEEVDRRAYPNRAENTVVVNNP